MEILMQNKGVKGWAISLALCVALTAPVWPDVLIQDENNDGEDDLRIDATSQLLMPGTGRVGIGTDSPEAPLSVTEDWDSSLPAGSYDNPELKALMQIRAHPAKNHQGSLIKFDTLSYMGSFRSESIDGVSAPASYGLVFGTGSAQTNAAVERMRIDHTGDVGIGTGRPEARLSITEDWDSSFPAGSYDNPELKAMIQIRANPAKNNQGSLIKFDSLSYVGSFRADSIDGVPANASYGLIFGTGSAQTNAAVERMRIDHDGNVGLGTPRPEAKLDVRGEVKAENFVFHPPLPPDYVFEADYPLMPLAKLEKVIKAAKHLPGIPSAKEIHRQGGVRMGDMQMALLEKIEELTLYTIAQQKQIDALQKRLSNGDDAQAEQPVGFWARVWQKWTR